MKKSIGMMLALSVAAMLASSPASAAANVVVAQPGATQTSTFATPVVVLSKSAPAHLVHADPIGGIHDVTSHQKRSNGQPWFKSDSISMGVAKITGLSDTPPGEYTFKCSVHPLMRGEATVVD